MKIKQINKTKVQVFEERELSEKLGLPNEQVNLILNYQEKFPELLQEKEGFCVDARNLHEKLEIGAEYTTWIKRRIKKYEFTEGIDFTTFDNSVKAKNTYINTKEYMIALNMAKELCMIENNKIGREIRKYFIVMENTLRNYENWKVTRGIEKDGWNDMTDCIKQWCLRKGYDPTVRTFYTREANLINQALLDYTASEINWKLNNDDRLTRNHLTTDINNAISYLQELNCSLLFADMSFEQRSEIIKTTCLNRYKQLKEEFLEIVA